MYDKIFHPNRLRVVLAEKQIKNRWLAEQLGKSEMTISRWSTNKTQPSLDQLIEIAKLLDVKLDDLLEPYNTK
ncbi:MAG: helix-turn-helix transcriptional regulator [Alistipes communis]